MTELEQLALTMLINGSLSIRPYKYHVNYLPHAFNLTYLLVQQISISFVQLQNREIQK